MNNELRDALNDLISEIGVTQTHLDCVYLVHNHYDELRGDDKTALAHINQVNAMIDAHQQKLEKIMELANAVWDAAFGKAESDNLTIFETRETATKRTDEQCRTSDK